MSNVKRIALVAAAVVAAAATSAQAGGTKYAANLVTAASSDPPAPGTPTLSPKSSLKLDSKGTVAIALAGVVDGAGIPVTTSTSYKDTGTLDGSEYTVIIKLSVTAINGLFPVVEVPIAVELKAGKGKVKLSVASFLSLIPAGAARTVEITGAEVWGPLGAGTPASDCQAVVSNSLPVGLPLNPGVCRGGTQIGISGLYIPPIAP